MLSVFRQGGAAQLAMGAVVVAIIIVFVMPTVGQGGSIEVECSVKIEDECVSLKDYWSNFGLATSVNMQGGLGRVQPKAIKALKMNRLILDGLVERELLLKEAKKLGLGVSEDAVTDELAAGRFHVSLPAAKFAEVGGSIGLVTTDGQLQMIRHLPVHNTKTKEFDYEGRYKRVVGTIAQRSPSEFREQQSKEIIANRMRALVRSRVRISPEEGWLDFERLEAKAQIRSVSTHHSWFERYVVDTSDKAVDAWAAEHQAEVDGAWEKEKANWTADCLLVREIVVPFGAGADDDTQKLRRTEIDEAKTRLDDKESFVSVARDLSDGPTASLGGELGCLTEKYGAGHEVLTEAAGKLASGAVSGVLKTDAGFHLIQSEGKLAAADVETTGKRFVARKLASKAAAEELAKQFSQAVLDAAKKGEGLEAIADRLTLEYASRNRKLKEGEKPPGLGNDNRPKLVVSGTFGRGSGVALAGTIEDVASHAFSLEKADTVHPNLVKLNDGFAVVQLKEKTPADRAKYEKERAKWLGQLRQAKELEALANYVSKLRSDAKNIELHAGLLEGKKKTTDGQ